LTARLNPLPGRRVPENFLKWLEAEGGKRKRLLRNYLINLARGLV
jgi:hypothetical protein